MTKRCTKCGEDKALDQFSKTFHKSRGKYYYMSYCRPCHRAYSLARMHAKYHAMSPDERRSYNMWGDHKLRREDYEATLKKQSGACAICREAFSSKPQIDHDHATGAVRGLLCTVCNTALGKFKDSPTVVSNALNYLKEYGKCS